MLLFLVETFENLHSKQRSWKNIDNAQLQYLKLDLTLNSYFHLHSLIPIINTSGIIHLTSAIKRNQLKNVNKKTKQKISKNELPLRVVSATFLLVCFVCQKRALVKQGKMFFISLRKLFSFLR